MVTWFSNEISSTITRKVCANCGHTYIEGDRNCRFCGAPMGEPKFIEEEMAIIYGPMPMKRVHKCENCGYEWETKQMTDRQRCCPKCGGPAPASEDRNALSSLPEL